jgi:hypothetical protein
MMSAAKGNLTIFRATDYIQEKYYNLKSWRSGAYTNKQCTV